MRNRFELLPEEIKAGILLEQDCLVELYDEQTERIARDPALKALLEERQRVDELNGGRRR